MKKLRVQKLNASHGRKVYALTEGPSVRSDQVIVITAETTELASLILDEIDAGNAVSWPYMRRDAVSLRDGTGPSTNVSREMWAAGLRWTDDPSVSVSTEERIDSALTRLQNKEIGK